MKSKTLMYALIAVALGIVGTAIASKNGGYEAVIEIAGKIIGNGYRDDNPECKDQKITGSDCGTATAGAVRAPDKAGM